LDGEEDAQLRNEHRSIQSAIKSALSEKGYIVEAEIDGTNYLPDKERHWYQPDVVVRDGKREIRYIVEVENDPTRKTLVGASILADYSIGETGQRRKPCLIFVVYSKEGIKQIHNFEEKLVIARTYCGHLEAIEVVAWGSFKPAEL